MKHILLLAAFICGSLALFSAQAQEREKQKSQPTAAPGTQQPSPGQLLVTSSPSGLEVYLEHEKEPPKTNLMRFGVIEAKLAGKTPLILDLSAGDYTVAVATSFNSSNALVAKVDRSCQYGLSLAGSALQWMCWKCNFYPTNNQQLRDPIDPYKRDGNIGFCFYASDEGNSPIRYYRLYAVKKGSEAVRLEAKFGKDGAKRLPASSNKTVDKVTPTRDLANCAGSPLLLAACKGEVAKVKSLLTTGTNVNDKDDLGNTALMEASSMGHTAVVETLLAKRAYINAASADDWTALMLAALNGHTPVVKTLLAWRANINAKNAQGDTALLLAAKNDHVETVKTLLANGANVNARGQNNWTALMLMTLKGRVDVVQALLRKGADASVKNDFDKTALSLAEEEKHLEVIQLLKNYSAKQTVR